MKSLILIMFCLPVTLVAETYQSHEFKTSLIELYTSEGCSSCPPAEEWLSKMYQKGFKKKNIIPLAFHVTYWDYLGWNDSFAKKIYDQRQRNMVRREGGSTVYTPQLFLNGKTLRSVSSLKSQLSKTRKIPAQASIQSVTSETTDDFIVDVSVDSMKGLVGSTVQVNIVGYQNNINSSIKAGENKGNNALHQYVVREIKTVLLDLKKANNKRFAFKKDDVTDWSGFVIFLEANGEVVQTLHVSIKKRA